MRVINLAILAVAVAMTGSSQSADQDRFVGAWHLVSIAAPGPDGHTISVSHPTGMLIYTRDGHMSVQLLYPKEASAISNEYVLNGYEASFGSYDVNTAAHTVTHHVQGANTRDRLMGKNLPRVYEFSAEGDLIIKSVRTDEHWSVTWKHY